jgi:hypothetical protein
MFSKLPRALAPATLSITLAAAAVAWAAPARTAELSETATVYEWDGGPVTGTPINDVSVDDTLIKLTAGGTVDVSFTDVPNPEINDLDMDFYKADSAGEPSGDPLFEAAEAGNDDRISAKNLKPGDYLIRVYGFTSFEATFKGKATFKPAPGPVEPPANPEQPPASPQQPPAAADATPVAKLGKVAKAVKAKRLKGFSGTATDDKGVARVELALVRRQGSKCQQLVARGKWAALAKCDGPSSFLAAKGTSKWSFRLSRKLKKGSYTVFAQAVDSAGQKQAGFSAANKRAFKVR